MFDEMGSRSVWLAKTSTTQPALGEYGWVWVTLVGVAGWLAWRRFNKWRDQREEQRQHDERWGQRDGETTEAWQARVAQQKADDARREQQWNNERMQREMRNREYRARRAQRGRGGRGDFEAPGGWGGLGPGE
jgi:hypothetical protein